MHRVKGRGKGGGTAASSLGTVGMGFHVAVEVT